MRAIAFFIAVSICSCAFAQPQRPERNVARSKATLAQALAEVTWKDGELVTTQGRTTAGDGGGNQYIYHSSGWSGLSSPDGYGFHIRVGATDAYLEAKDKSIARASQFGVDGSGDDSTELQACFDAAVAEGVNVELPPHAFTASVLVETTGNQVPNVIGKKFKTQWFAPSNDVWMLTIDMTNSDAGKNLLISNVTFADSFLAHVNSGVQLLMHSGPVRFENCDFRYLLIGCALNGNYATQFDSCNFQNNQIGLLHTVRQASNTMTVKSRTVTFRDPIHLQHSGINQLNNCAFSSNNIGWMFEDPDRNVGGAASSSIATNCIFQGAGCGVWNRDVLTTIGEPGLQFNTCHWEATGSGTVSIDGATVNEGDMQLDAACHVVITNGVPNRVTQTDYTFIKVLGAGNYPTVHNKTALSVFEVDHAAGYITRNKESTADTIFAWAENTGYGGLSRAKQKRLDILPQNVTLEKKFLLFADELPITSGSGVTRTAVEDETHQTGQALEVVTTVNNTGVQYLGGNNTPGEHWYVSFDIKSDADDFPVRFIPLGNTTSDIISTTTEWQTFHWCGWMSNTDTRLRWWSYETTGTFYLANIQVVKVKDDIQSLLDYQKSNIFPVTDLELARIRKSVFRKSGNTAARSIFDNDLGTAHAWLVEWRDTDDMETYVWNGSGWQAANGHPHAQISCEDNATATTVSSTQSDWSAKSQFVGFSSDFPDSLYATPDHTNDHITLTSAGTWEVSCVVTLSGSVVSDLWELALWKNNGATQVSTKQGVNIRGAGLTYEKQVTISGLVDASANDTIELWVQRTNGTGSITITNAVMTALKVSD